MKPLPTPPLAPPTSPIERLPEEWSAQLAAWGEPRYRGLQVFRWIHARGVFDPAQMTDLPRSLREKMAAEGPIAPALEVAHQHDSDDGTRKLVVRFADQRSVETVLIPMKSAPRGDTFAPEDPDGTEDAEDVATHPVTQCVSSQVGCAMGCVFCASGVAGIKRNLTAAEIVSQVLVGRTLVGEGQRLRNVVFMGMGEPLANYDAVARALVLLCHPDGLNLSRRRVTVSTSGLVPQIDRLGSDFGGQVQLAVSLHAPTDAQRSELMPINKKHPLPELLAAMRRYPMPKRRRITVEYTLIRGVNASVADARALAAVLRGIPSKVNLIPMNGIEGSPLEPPSWEEVDAFQDALRAAGVPNFVRRRKGDDIAAACGQLALRGEARKIRVALPTIAR